MSQENVEVIRKLYDHLGRGEYFVAPLLDEDFAFARHGEALGLLGGEWRGFEDVRAAVLEYLRSWDGLRNELERITDLDDERVLVFERQVGRGRNSGLVMERKMGSLFTLRDGKIVRWDTYWERADALEAAGLSESQANVDAMRKVYEAMARGDFWVAGEVFDPEIEWSWSSTMSGLTGVKTYHGSRVSRQRLAMSSKLGRCSGRRPRSSSRKAMTLWLWSACTDG
jgi:ketosteroid isomerase-like protein